MTTLESKQISITQSPQEVFEFFCDFNNIGSLMPSQVEEFTTDGTICSFTIKGMAKLALEYESRLPFNKVVLKSKGKGPFDFWLKCHISGEGQVSTLQLSLDAELNPFLKMMAEKPLTNFLNLLVDNYKGKCNT